MAQTQIGGATMCRKISELRYDRCLHIAGVTGSSPVPPTMFHDDLVSCPACEAALKASPPCPEFGKSARMAARPIKSDLPPLPKCG